MSEHPHRRRELLKHSDTITPEDTVDAHRILLAAIAAAGQLSDGSIPVPYTPDTNPNRIVDFGMDVEDITNKKPNTRVDYSKKRLLERSLARAKKPVESEASNKK